MSTPQDTKSPRKRKTKEPASAAISVETVENEDGTTSTTTLYPNGGRRETFDAAGRRIYIDDWFNDLSPYWLDLGYKNQDPLAVSDE